MNWLVVVPVPSAVSATFLLGERTRALLLLLPLSPSLLVQAMHYDTTSTLSLMKKTRMNQRTPDNGPAAEDIYSPALASAITRTTTTTHIPHAHPRHHASHIVQSKVPWLRLGAVAIASAESGIHAAVDQCEEAFVERSTRISGASPQTTFVIQDLRVADVGVLLKALEEVGGLKLTAGTAKALRNIVGSYELGEAGPPTSDSYKVRRRCI